MPELAAGEHLRPLLGRVLEPQLQRVHADLLRQHVEHALDRVGAHRRARRPIGRDLRTVAHHVVADRVRVRDVVGRERAHARAHERRARECAGLQLEQPVGRRDRAVALDADLHGHRRARGRAGRAENVLAAHHQLDRSTGFLRQHHADRLDIDHGLAAERAADLGRIDAQIAELHAEQLRRIGTHDEMPLARAPQLGLSVGVEAGDAPLRLDIGLVHGRGLERHLDDLVRGRKARREVAQLVLDALGDVGRLRRRLDAAGDQVVEQQRRVRRHRGVDVDHVRQHLVVDRDQRQRLVGDRLAGGRDGHDRMALVEHLLARHDVARHVPEILRDAFRPDILELLLREVRRGDHCLHARQRRRLGDVDRADARMGVRRAQDAAGQHARHGEIRPVQRAPRHLRHAVRPHRPGSDPFERPVFFRRNVLHGCLPGCDRAWICRTVARQAGKCKRLRARVMGALRCQRYPAAHWRGGSSEAAKLRSEGWGDYACSEFAIAVRKPAAEQAAPHP